MTSRRPPWVVAALLALAAGSASAATTVNYINPEKFTDVPFASWDREDALKNLTEHFQKLGENLPAGQDLHIDVTDVDLAGREYPSARAGRDIRIMRGMADWPRMELRYTIEQNGQVIKSGDGHLQSMDYQERINRYFDSDAFRYEKQMMDDWFAKNIAPIRSRR